MLNEVIDGDAVRRGGRRVVLAIDESSKADAVQLFRVSLPYRGGSLPLAWAVWQQHQPLPAGQYWAHVDRVLAQVAQLLPPALEVIAVADRAEDAWCFAVLEEHVVFAGKDPYWASRVVEEAAKYGFHADESGKMIKPANYEDLREQLRRKLEGGG